MLTGLRRWWGLPRGERRDFLALCLLLPLIAASLRLRGYRATRRGVERLGGTSRTLHAPLHNAQRLAELAAIAGSRAPVATTCLPQALAVMLLLRRRGVHPELRFGVDHRDARHDMHAWLELNGHALGQANLRHKPFNR